MLEGRVGSIETQLQAFQQTTTDTRQQASHSNSSSAPNTSSTVSSTPPPLFHPPLASVASSALSTSADGFSQLLLLPDLDSILPFVERFFKHTNSLIPLFDKSEFLCWLMDWFSPLTAAGSYSPRYDLGADRSAPRNAVFAAINVVLALSCRIVQEPSQDIDLTADDPLAEQYKRNVEQMIPAMVSGAESLVALQALLGMLLLYIGSRDDQPATVLIGSAVQLCNRLRLNSRDENARYSASARLQRERVFWITYILDKVSPLPYLTCPFPFHCLSLPHQLASIRTFNRKLMLFYPGHQPTISHAVAHCG